MVMSGSKNVSERDVCKEIDNTCSKYDYHFLSLIVNIFGGTYIHIY